MVEQLIKGKWVKSPIQVKTIRMVEAHNGKIKYHNPNSLPQIKDIFDERRRQGRINLKPKRIKP